MGPRYILQLYKIKYSKIAKISTTTRAKERRSTYLEPLELWISMMNVSTASKYVKCYIFKLSTDI
jgi:hypothetical protein